jgi:predicted RNase H-like nuclease (RuvC/YqgF family)
LEHTEVTPFVTQGESGKLLDEQGFGVLCAILGNSRAHVQSGEGNTIETDEVETTHTKRTAEKERIHDVYLDKYIVTLEDTIEKLEQEKAELQKKYNDMVNFFMQIQQQKLIENREVKRNFWDFLRKK